MVKQRVSTMFCTTGAEFQFWAKSRESYLRMQIAVFSFLWSSATFISERLTVGLPAGFC